MIGPFFEAMSAAGNAIFSNLPLLFAIGVAIGFAKRADGSTAMSAAAGYLVIDAVFKTMSPVVLRGVVNQAGDQAGVGIEREQHAPPRRPALPQRQRRPQTSHRTSCQRRRLALPLKGR